MLLLGWDWVYNFGMGFDRCGVWQFKEWKDRNVLKKLYGLWVNRVMSVSFYVIWKEMLLENLK